MAKYFTEILGNEITSEKIHSLYQGKKRGTLLPHEIKNILHKLNYLINEEINPGNPMDELNIIDTDIKDNELRDTFEKYNTFKKTIRKSTSSSDLSSEERESRRHTRQLDFIAKDKSSEKSETKTKKNSPIDKIDEINTTIKENKSTSS
jgi:hypothetical protein